MLRKKKMVNKIRFPVSDNALNKSTEIIIEDTETRSNPSSISSSDSSSSLGFGDLENETIYDHIVALDTPFNDNFVKDTSIENAIVKNSQGIVFGNSVTIEGTVIFDRPVNVTHKDYEKNESPKEEIDQKDAPNEINIDLKSNHTNTHPSKTRRKLLISVIILSVSVILGVTTVLITHFISF